MLLLKSSNPIVQYSMEIIESCATIARITPATKEGQLPFIEQVFLTHPSQTVFFLKPTGTKLCNTPRDTTEFYEKLEREHNLDAYVLQARLRYDEGCAGSLLIDADDGHSYWVGDAAPNKANVFTIVTPSFAIAAIWGRSPELLIATIRTLQAKNEQFNLLSTQTDD